MKPWIFNTPDAVLRPLQPAGCAEYGATSSACPMLLLQIVTNEYYYGVAVALLLQDHLTMSLSRFADQTANTIYMSTTVQQEHKKRVNPQRNTP